MPTLDDKVDQKYAGKIRNLVFEGGGVWGIAYEGALLELEQLGILEHVKRVGGASAGAITAGMLAVGYQPAEIGAVLRTTNFKDFMDEDWGFGRDTARLLEDFGWYKGETFKKWMREKIAAKVSALSKQHGVASPGDQPRLAELATWRAALAAKGLHLPEPFLVGSNISQQCREVYSAEKSPELKLEDAVRRSMSIPLFFACARGAEHGNKRDVIVDGGLTWNYPVNLFDDRMYLDDDENGVKTIYAADDEHVFNTETLGFRVDTTKELEFNLKDWNNEPAKVDNIVHFGWALVTFIRAIANKVHLHKNDWARTIFIDVGEEIGYTDFDLSKEQQQFLSDRGREGVRKYFEWLVSQKGQKETAEIVKSISA
jgi:NTE family protein